MKTINDIQYSSYPETLIDVHLPETDTFPVFIYFHGGGLEAGTKNFDINLYKTLVNNGIAVVTANYRMYPSARYPEFIVDSASACKWAVEHMGEYGNVTGYWVGGSSAGGYLSMMLCFDPSYLAAVGLTPLSFNGFVLDAGQPTCHFNVLRERGLDTRRVIIDESAPLYHIGTSEKYPDMLIIVSDDDMFNRLEQTRLMESTLIHFGHKNFKSVLMHGKHCQYVTAVDENGVSVFGKIVTEFIRK